MLDLGSWIFSGCWMLDVECFSFSSLKPVSLFPVMLFNIVGHFRQGIFDCLNEVPTTRGHTSQAYHCFALSQIISHCENFSIGSESVCGPFDHLIGGLAAARVEHLQFRRGGRRRRSGGSAPAIKKD